MLKPVLIGLAFFAVSAARAQESDAPDEALPPAPAWPPASHYYEARITPEGYAIYVPFFIPRPADSGEGARLPMPPGPSPKDRSVEGAVPSYSRLELRTREEVIPGEFIQVYRPAVYALDGQGRMRLIEPEETVTLPKIRIVLERIWLNVLPPDRPLTEDGAPPESGKPPAPASPHTRDTDRKKAEPAAP